MGKASTGFGALRKKMNGVIYRASFPSGKVYIGQTVKTLEERKKYHQYIAFNPKSPRFNSKINNAIRKYCNEIIWEILEYDICDQKQMNELEIFYIEKYDSYNSGYNSTTGGDNGFSIKRKPLSEEQKKRISNSMKGKNTWNSFRIISDETRKKLSKRMIGEKHPMYGMKKEKCPSTKLFQIQDTNKIIHNFISIKEVKDFFKQYNIDNKLVGPNRVGYKSLLANNQCKGWKVLNKEKIYEKESQ